MGIRLIALDMDGTVLRTDKTVSERTLQALRGAVAKGIAVVPATGRIAKMVPKPVASVPGVRYAITSNGAAVADLQEKVFLYTNLMSREDTDRLLRMLDPCGLLVEAYCGGVSYSDQLRMDMFSHYSVPPLIYNYVVESQIFVENLPEYVASNGYRLEKVNIPYVPDSMQGPLREQILAAGGYSVVSASLVNLEINKAGVSKGDGLAHLCGRLGISPSEVLACGDGDNDFEMIRFAGVGVAMENSIPELKAAADFVTDTNDGDGVAKAIEKFALSC